MGYTVYGVSPSDSQSHGMLQQIQGFDFELLSDMELHFATELGFYDEEEGYIFRGYTAVNPDSGAMITETDYLVGENSDEVIANLEDL